MKLTSRSLFWMTSTLSVVAAAAALLHPIPAVADERVYLSKPEIQSSLIGKTTLSKIRASGMGRGTAT